MADDPKPGRLRNLRVKRVSIVDVGANFDKATGDGAHIMLFKRHVEKDGPSLGAVHVDTIGGKEDDKDKRKTNLKEKNVKKSLFKSLLSLIPQTDANKTQITEVTKAVEELDDDVVAKAAHVPGDPNCKCADCMEKRKNFTGDPTVIEGIVTKALADVQKKHEAEVAKLTTANTALAATIEVEKAARLDGEMRDILKSFKHVSVDLNKDVPRFRKMKVADPESYDRAIEMLKAADAQLATSKSFETIGSGRSGGRGNAWEEIKNLAKKNVTKGANGVTLEQAIDDVCMDPDNIELVKRYRAEQN